MEQISYINDLTIVCYPFVSGWWAGGGRGGGGGGSGPLSNCGDAQIRSRDGCSVTRPQPNNRCDKGFTDHVIPETMSKGKVNQCLFVTSGP